MVKGLKSASTLRTSPPILYLSPDHAEVAGMHCHIRVRQLPKPAVQTMSIREMQNFQNTQIETVLLNYLATWHLSAAKLRIGG